MAIVREGGSSELPKPPLATPMWCLSHWLDWWKHSLCWSVCSVQEMEDEFLSASLRGDLPAVEQLLANGIPVIAKNKVKYTHLSVYIQSCQAACFHSVEHSHSNVTSLPPPTTHSSFRVCRMWSMSGCFSVQSI